MRLCSDLDFIHLADDSTVYKSGHYINDLCVYFNNELSKVNKWRCANKLLLNTSKSIFSVFTNKFLDVVICAEHFNPQCCFYIRQETLNFRELFWTLNLILRNILTAFSYSY